MAQRTRYRTAADFPSWVRTLGAMKLQGIVPRAWCVICGVSRDVDLDGLIAAKGESYSLIDRRSRCTLTEGCEGWVWFQFQGHGCRRWLRTEAREMALAFG